MDTFGILTIVGGIITIIVNICIAIYNAGKNRKIYEIESLSNFSEVNQKLKTGDYTILHIGADFKLMNKVIYILGRVGLWRMIMNSKQLIVMWLMAVPICAVWVDWTINHGNSTRPNLTAALISTHIITIILGGLLIYTLQDRNK